MFKVLFILKSTYTKFDCPQSLYLCGFPGLPRDKSPIVFSVGKLSRLLPKAITYDKDAVQTSPEDKMSEIAAEVADIEAKLRSLVVMKRRTIHDVSMSIAKLDSDAEQIVLLGFFVGGLSAQRIAETVHYTVRSVYRLKRRAVRNLSIKLSQMSQ